MDKVLQDRIQTAAMKRFTSYGIKGVTMDDIAKEVGISKKTLYQVFPDKKSLVLEAIKVAMYDDWVAMEKITQDSNDAVEMFLKTFALFSSRFKSINPIVFTDLEKFFPNAWNVYKEHKHGCFFENMMLQFKKGVEEGYFIKDISYEILTKLRMWQVELAFNPEAFPPSEYSIQEVHQTFFEHFMRGISTIEGLRKIESYKELINEQL